jgi:hypothetical protein
MRSNGPYIFRASQRALCVLMLGLAPAIAQPAAAHEFNAVLIVPPGASAQSVRDTMQTAFLLATRERDGHPAETSEGHLGGLDVQLTVVAADQPDAVAAENPQFIAAPLMSKADVAGLSVVAPGAVTLWQSDIEQPASKAMLAGDTGLGIAPFRDQFLRETGTLPDAAATSDYLMARWIDRLVRPLGAADDRAALLRGLGRADDSATGVPVAP